jgi:hypothetical protein
MEPQLQSIQHVAAVATWQRRAVIGLTVGATVAAVALLATTPVAAMVGFLIATLMGCLAPRHSLAEAADRADLELRLPQTLGTLIRSPNEHRHLVTRLPDAARIDRVRLPVRRWPLVVALLLVMAASIVHIRPTDPLDELAARHEASPMGDDSRAAARLDEASPRTEPAVERELPSREGEAGGEAATSGSQTAADGGTGQTQTESDSASRDALVQRSRGGNEGEAAGSAGATEAGTGTSAERGVDGVAAVDRPSDLGDASINKSTKQQDSFDVLPLRYHDLARRYFAE